MDESETDPFKQNSNPIPSFSIQHPKVPPQNSAPKKSRSWTIPCLLALPILISLFIFIRSQSSDNTEPLEETVPIKPTILFQQSKMQAPPMKNTPRLDHRNRVLCQILNNTNCQSNFIADSIDLFWVIAPLYNFDEAIDWYYYEKHEGFKSYIKSIGLPFITIEAIRYPDTKPMWSREPTKYHATVPDNEPYDMQVYYYNMSYIRENLLNVAIRKLDKQLPWGYAVWIDAHQVFENPYWWEESIYKSEKYGSVQLFDSISYLSAENVSYIDLFGILRISLFVNHINVRKTAYGNAYAIAKDTYNKIGYIYDECIATHCDCAYTLASFPDGVGFNIPFPNYYKNFDTWIANTKKVFQAKRAYVRGHLQHLFHAGAFPYGDLAVACEKYGFNAATDITRDANFSLIISNKELVGGMDWIIYEAKRNRAQSLG